MIRILLIDNLTVVRESLAVALTTTTDMEVECCSNTEEGIEILRRQPGSFDVVLLKQAIDGEKADELLSFTNQNGLNGRVLILTPRLSTLERRRLAGLGVAGIFSKQRSLQDLAGAIHAVAGGQTYLDKPPAQNGRRPDRGALTGQERRAAELVFEGLTNKEIGARMGASESYIKAVLQRVFLKMGVRSRGQLVRVLLNPQAHPDWPLPVSQPAVLYPS